MTNVTFEAYVCKIIIKKIKNKGAGVSVTTSIPRGHVQWLMRYFVVNGSSENLVHKRCISNNNELQIGINFPLLFSFISEQF